MKNAKSAPTSAEATGRELANAISGSDPGAPEGPRKVDGRANATGRELAQAIPSTQPQDRRARIERIAYANAERRSFAAGGELDDWLAAEREVDEAPIKNSQSSS